MGQGVTQKPKQWGASDGSLQITLLLNPKFWDPFSVSVTCLFVFRVHGTVTAEISWGIAPRYRAAENEWETEQTKGVILCCN